MRPSRRLSAPLLLAGSLTLAAGCAARPIAQPREPLRSEHFVLEVSSADPRVASAALEELERSVPILESLTGIAAPAGAAPLRVALASSDAERFASSNASLPASRLALLPARASRIDGAASLALPRPQVAPFLPDSTRVTLVHEAAHLWIFRGLPGESRVPASLHEGLAELAAERAELARLRRPAGSIAPSFLRESVPALQSASFPGIGELLATPPRESPSPQRWTAAAWWLVRTLAAPPEGEARVREWVRRCAAGEDAIASMESQLGPKQWVAATLAAALETARPSEIAEGRDVSRLEDGALLLAPAPGTRVWCFDAQERDARDFEWSADVEALGGGAPELWLGFGFDDRENGARVVIRRSGRATVEPVVEGVPVYALDAELPAGVVAGPGSFPVRVRRDGGRVTIRVRTSSVELPMPRGVDAPFGRFGVGARGGAFVVRGARLETRSPGGENPGRS